VFSAAAEEFAEHGYEAAGVDRIAARAGVNKAMIYYHFGSKQGLYAEVLRDMLDAVRTRARALAAADTEPARKLDEWIVAIVEEAAARPWFPPIMLREIASGIAHLDQRVFPLLQDIFLAVRDMIVEGQQRGAFRDVDPLLTHLTIMPATMTYFVREATVAKRAQGPLATPRSREQFITHMQQTVRGMLRKD
jgi:TetR/AcrR family transcriptional regulator